MFANLPAMPPAIAKGEEVVAFSGPAYDRCDKAFSQVSAGEITIDERAFTYSPKWGHVLRVKFKVGVNGELSSPFLFRCWIKDDGRPQVAIMMASEAVDASNVAGK